jgi:hypothetical protein
MFRGRGRLRLGGQLLWEGRGRFGLLLRFHSTVNLALVMGVIEFEWERRGGTGDARAGLVNSSAGMEYCSCNISAIVSIRSSRTTFQHTIDVSSERVR